MQGAPRLPARYRPLSLLGEGGSGRVWLVEDSQQGGTRMALKELINPATRNVNALRQEFAMLCNLRHPNLVEVFSFETIPETGSPCFTLEHIDGDDLSETVRLSGPKTFVELAVEALRALAFLHDFGVIHRDIKPGNLLVRRVPRIGCRLVMLDFGLASSHGSNGPNPATTAGTLRYLAPEVFDGSEPGVKTDLYALGAVLFEAIHRIPPFELESGRLPEFIERVRSGRRARPALPEGYPEGLQSWIESMLSPDPAARPATAAEALARLSAAYETRFAAETPSGRAARLASGAPAGRKAEIARLRELSETDTSSLIWISGGPGRGKKRLLRWLTGDRVASGWHEVTLEPSMASYDAPRIEGLLTELEQIGQEKRICVVMPEIERAGERTAQLLERIVYTERSQPIQLIVSARWEGIQHPQIKQLLAQADVVPAIHRVELPAIDLDGLESLIERATGNRPTRSHRLRWFEGVCEGRVDFAEALLIDGAWERGEQAEISLDLSIGSLFDDLPPRETKILETLSLAQCPVDPQSIATIAEVDLNKACEAMIALCGMGVARRTKDAWSIETASLARVVTERMADAPRRALYRRMAEKLEGQPGFGPELLARLWSGAGDPESSIRHSLAAADRMSGLGDHSLEAEHCADALRYLPRKDARRFGLRMRHGSALRNAGRHVHAARAYAAARVVAPDSRARVDAMAHHAVTLVYTSQVELAHSVARRARAFALETGDALSAGRARIAEGIAAARQEQGKQSLDLLRQAVAELEPLGDDAALLDAVHSLATAEVNHDPVADASATFTRAIELAERTGQTGRVAMSYGGLAIGDFRQGRLASAAKHFERAVRISAKHHRRRQEAVALGHTCYHAALMGNFAQALELGKESMLAGTQIGEDKVFLYGASTSALVLARCGRAAEGALQLERVLAARTESMELCHRVHALLIQIEVCLMTPDLDLGEIAALLEVAIPEVRRAEDPDTLLWGFTLEMALLARQGRPLQAKRAELERWRALGGGWTHPYFALVADLIEAGAGNDGLAASRNAVRRAEDLDLPHLAAKAYACLANQLEAADQRPAAEEAREKGTIALNRACDRIDDTSLAASFRDAEEFKPLASVAREHTRSIDRRLATVYALIRKLNSLDDPESMLESILDMALEVVHAERGMILLCDEGSGEFSVHLARNLEHETIADAGAFSDGIVAQAGSGKAVLSLDARKDSRFAELKSVSLYGIHALMCVPLRAHGKIVGAVYVDSKEDGLFTPDDLRFLEGFADHAALALANTRKRIELTEDTERLQQEAAERADRGNLIGNSPQMQRVFELIDKVTASELPVLVHGESGTGKELVAQAIHYNGPRGKRVFISENCAAIPDTLLQSELFGHVRGAFTGADRDRAGLFEQADGGTLFLDEIGDMSPTMQAQVLRALQEGEIRRVGGTKPIHVDVRIIAATHRDLQQETAAGRFREDLLYRLQVLLIELPPLRERHGDVRRLIRHFLQRIADERGRAPQGIDGAMLDRLERYSWPGNVRQLQNTLQRLSLLAGDGPIGTDLLALDAGLRTLLAGNERDLSPVSQAPLSLSSSERDRIVEALDSADGNRSRAARLLGISRATIYRKIKELKL